MSAVSFGLGSELKLKPNKVVGGELRSLSKWGVEVSERDTNIQHDTTIMTQPS